MAKLKLSNLFFWRKGKAKNKEVNKAEEMLQMYLKYIPQIRAIANGQTLQNVTDGEMIGRMYDFFANYGGHGGAFLHAAHPVADGDGMNPEDFAIDNLAENGIDVDERFKKERKVAKPVDVVAELETVPTPFTLEGLDEKIKLFKSKSKISSQRYAKAQIDGFLKRLENRKVYVENIKFFSRFPNTTDDKIDALLANYKLEMNESELFVPTFPKEATDVMEEYTDICEKLFKEKPVFYVIAEEKDFKKKREKLDPILLVQSPFGFYWQILGAWDKEMLLLTELQFNNKALSKKRSKMDSRVKVNSVIQLNENAQEGWRGCLAQVDEVKPWGVQAWVEIPMQGSAFIRVTWEQMDYIGEAVLVKSNPNDENRA